MPGVKSTASYVEHHARNPLERSIDFQRLLRKARVKHTVYETYIEQEMDPDFLDLIDVKKDRKIKTAIKPGSKNEYDIATFDWAADVFLHLFIDRKLQLKLLGKISVKRWMSLCATLLSNIRKDEAEQNYVMNLRDRGPEFLKQYYEKELRIILGDQSDAKDTSQ